MSLVDLQRDIQSVCLADEPDAATLKRLGNERIFRIYRDMVRRRLYGELKNAFGRTHAAAGDEAFKAVFSKFMTEQPPRRRFFHDVPVEFAAMAAPVFRDSADVPPYAVDLLLYEAARWQVSDLPGVTKSDSSVVEFDFELPTILHPTVRLLALDHPVHTKAPADGVYSRKPTYLLLYRATDADRVHWLSIRAHTHALLLQLQSEGGTMTHAIRQLSQSQGVVVDGDFIDTLCGELAAFVDKQVILGSRSQPAG